jgi:phosphate-selective porin OprO and OprP
MQTKPLPFFGRPFHQLLLTAAALSAPALSGQTDPNEVQLLREQLAAIQARLEALEKTPPPAAQPAAPASTAPVVSAGAGGFSLTAPDKSYQLRIRGNIQTDARVFLGDSPGRDTFLVRRLRPIFQGTLANDFSYRVMPDFAPSTFNLLEAFGTYHHSPAFNLLVGKTKSPFDLERLVSQTDLLFIERAHPTTLGPNRDIGIQVYGDLLEGRLTYQLAVQNGVTDNSNSITDADNDKDFVARLFAHPFMGSDGPLEGLGLGFAISHGERTGAISGYRTQAQQTFFSWRDGTVSAGDNTRFSPQFYYYNGPLGLIGSWVTSRHEVALAGQRARLSQDAWFLAASWVLTGEDSTYRGVRPKHNFSLADGNWGAWEVAVRYSELDIDDDAFPIFADPTTSATKASGYTLGVNWFLNRHVKLSLNYEHTDFSGGALGAVSGQDENAIFSRAQVSF